MYVKKGGRVKGNKKEGHIPINSVSRGALSSSVRNSFLQEGLILRIFKNVLGLLRGQVCIKTTHGITRNRGRGDYQRRTILHSLR